MAQASIMVYQEDDVIVKQGDPDKSLYKIISGKVALYMNYTKDNEYLMGIQTFPSCFGEMTILSGKPSLYTVVAITETKILRVPEENFESFIQDNPVNAVAIMKTMAKNISLLNMNIKMLTEEISYMSEQAGANSEALESIRDNLLGGNTEEADETSVTKGEKGFSFYLEGHKDYPDIKCKTKKEYTYLKEFVCPHCGTKFIAPCFNPTSVDENDLKKFNKYETRYECEDFQVEWYQVVTCSHCYFSTFADTFQKSDIVLHPTRYEDDLRRAFSSLFLSFSGTRTLDFVFAQYYLALICAKGMMDVKQICARLWLNLSRLYADVGNNILAYEAAKRAAEAFKKNHIGSVLKPKLEHRICVNIAGRLYAAGDLQTAKELALLVRTNKVEQTYYSKVAEDMIIDMRGKINKN